jgi:hypothetical protein
MPTGTVSEQIPAASSDVFRLLHDYKRRLEWDTLLKSAYLEAGHDEANINAVSVCTAKLRFGGIAIRTRYVAFRPGSLAAVQMINRPALFESFAASIRHTDISPSESMITYRFTFTAKPRILRFILHPVMSWIFGLETKRRLKALRDYFRRVIAAADRQAGV